MTRYSGRSMAVLLRAAEPAPAPGSARSAGAPRGGPSVETIRLTRRRGLASDHHLPAVDVELGPGDDAGQVRGQEGHGVGALGVVGDDPQGDVLGDLGNDLFAGAPERGQVVDVALDRRAPHPAHEG